jgi:predicted nucleotidyltransferase
MDPSTIALILRELNLNEDCVANIYNYGSWVYGTNSPTSDRDILIVTRSPAQAPLTFHQDFDYFHEFELHKLWNQYDVCVHSVENFESLLEKNYLLAIECIFLPDKFKIKEEIDFKKVYLEKYYNKLRLKQVGLYENLTAIKMYDLEDETTYPIRSSLADATSQASKDYLFKNLFHGVRYLDVVEQLIQTQSIHNYKRVSYLLKEMQDVRGDPADDFNRAR